MDYEVVNQWFRRKPFQPFRVFVKDGRIYEVRHRRMNLVAQSYIKIGIPVANGPSEQCDHTEYVAIKEIDRIEPIAEIEKIAVESAAPIGAPLEHEVVNQWFRQLPFQPFRLYVRDGRVYDVRYRNMNLVARSFVKIGIPDFNGAKPRCHHTEFVAIKQIDRIEALASSGTPNS